MFNITTNKGFEIKFANGNTVSVQFGKGNYCDNRYATTDHPDCKTAEVLAWDKDNNPLCEVQGWQTPDEVAAFIAKYSA